MKDKVNYKIVINWNKDYNVTRYIRFDKIYSIFMLDKFYKSNEDLFLDNTDNYATAYPIEFSEKECTNILTKIADSLDYEIKDITKIFDSFDLIYDYKGPDEFTISLLDELKLINFKKYNDIQNQRVDNFVDEYKEKYKFFFRFVETVSISLPLAIISTIMLYTNMDTDPVNHTHNGLFIGASLVWFPSVIGFLIAILTCYEYYSLSYICKFFKDKKDNKELKEIMDKQNTVWEEYCNNHKPRIDEKLKFAKALKYFSAF